MEKIEEILLVIDRLAGIGSQDDNVASVMCNAIEYLSDYAEEIVEKQEKNE